MDNAFAMGGIQCVGNFNGQREQCLVVHGPDR